MGNSVDTINIGYVGRGVDYVHPDGRTTQVRDPAINPETGEVIGNGDIEVDGQLKWRSGAGCPSPQYMARGILPNELLVVAAFRVPGSQYVVDATWRVDINVPDLCADIQRRINAAAPDVALPGGGSVTVGVDETMQFGTNGTWPNYGTDLMARDPATGAITHLQRNADGTWTPEPDQQYPSSELTLRGLMPFAVHKMAVDGHTYHLFVIETGDHTTSILKAFALEETGPNQFIERTLSMSQNPTPADDDGDGIPNSDDGCDRRANPSAVDENADGTPDACQVKECAKWPGIDPPTSPDETAECTSELGYSHAITFVADGSTAHSNEPIVLGTSGEILVQPGQEVRYVHSKDPRVDCAFQSAPVCESRQIKFPDGNSAHFKLNETDKLDGTPGVATFSRKPMDDPFGEPVVVTFSNPTTVWVDYDPGIGAILGSEGSDVTVRAGNENLPVPTCPPVCPPVDGGTADGGNDGGETPDAQPDTNDGGANDGGEPQDGSVEQPDGGTANDGGEQQDANGEPDAQPNPDSGGDADGNGNSQPDGNGDQPDASNQAGDGGPDASKDASVDAPTDSGATEKPKPPVCGACATPGDLAGNFAILALAAAGLRRRREKRE